MHKYFIKTPWLVKQLFSSYVWNLPPDDNAVYLTFDDGPHPIITNWVLDELKKYNAEATFFCIGNNVQRFPETYQKIIDAGHAVGNHTYNHFNGWKTPDKEYIEDVTEAAKLIRTNLFRPPYGRLKLRQARQIPSAMQMESAKIIMWDVLSADFDATLSHQQCLSNVIENTTAGSVIVFHDSEKAYRNLEFILPAALEYLSNEGHILKKIQL